MRITDKMRLDWLEKHTGRAGRECRLPAYLYLQIEDDDYDNDIPVRDIIDREIKREAKAALVRVEGKR